MTPEELAGIEARAPGMHPPNGEFLRAARSDVLALCAEVREVWQERDEAQVATRDHHARPCMTCIATEVERDDLATRLAAAEDREMRLREALFAIVDCYGMGQGADAFRQQVGGLVMDACEVLVGLEKGEGRRRAEKAIIALAERQLAEGR